MTTTGSTIYDEERQRDPPIIIQDTTNKIQIIKYKIQTTTGPAGVILGQLSSQPKLQNTKYKL